VLAVLPHQFQLDRWSNDTARESRGQRFRWS
jgi:hypothetical protein